MSEMAINRIDLWTESIFQVMVPDVDNASILEFALDKRTQDAGIVRSNLGGWQFDIDMNMCGAIDDMVDKIEHGLNHIFNDVFDIKINLGLANAWLNINNLGHKNSVHTHPGCIFSGVYYVTGKASPEDGEINFLREGAHSLETLFTQSQIMSEYSRTERDPMFRVAAAIPSLASRALLFAPYLMHEVRTNLNNEDRLVIGMNFNERK